MKVRLGRYREGGFVYEDYELDAEGKTVLEILQDIKERIDPTLSFRAFCRAGICGTCAVKVNGQHKLACRTRVWGDITVEPVDIAKPIRDLVVEHETMHQKLREGKVWFDPLPTNIPLKPDELRTTQRSWDCILCGICNWVCPALAQDGSFGLASTFTKAYGVIFDKRNANREEKLRAVAGLNPHLCTHCKNCTFACPNDCNPELLIKLIEGELVKEGLIQRKEQDFGFLGF
ncbi:MAG: succinate dehydrogenase/fumarate reductase iron-sulfur subunit [Aquificae bacterium]|nr:succinate dehydrogenase/fumarate reductase iron-sulfur subunit [Aquificota bacterium]